MLIKVEEWRAKTELATREKELLQDEQQRVLEAMQVVFLSLCIYVWTYI